MMYFIFINQKEGDHTMGFMGISRVVESDNASDLQFVMQEAINQALTSEMKNKAIFTSLSEAFIERRKGYKSAKEEWDSSPHNTPVCIDIALIVKENQKLFNLCYDKVLDQLMKKVEKDLETVKDVELDNFGGTNPEKVMPLYTWFKEFRCNFDK